MSYINYLFLKYKLSIWYKADIVTDASSEIFNVNFIKDVGIAIFFSRMKKKHYKNKTKCFKLILFKLIL